MTVGRICGPAGGRICTSCRATCRLDNARRAEKRKAHGLTVSQWGGPNGLRLRALRRDSYLCQIRLRGCTGKATTVHLDPWFEGDHRRATLSELVSACAHCHGVVDAPRARHR